MNAESGDIKALHAAPAVVPEKAKAEAPETAEAPVEKAGTPPAAPTREVTFAPSGTPLSQLFTELPSVTKEAGYNEMWGVELSDDSHVPSSIVLEKFLRANGKDVGKAKSQLTEALKWRKKINPAKLLAETEFDQSKFGGLGYVTVYPKTEAHAKEIITWNIYGAVKSNLETFGNVEEFIKWRAALMELSIRELDLASATEPIPAAGTDQYRMTQVHDYMNVSFLRMDPSIKAASKETIQTFAMAYPELLKEKFFVNVPLIMGWVFAAMKLFLSPETVKKFHPLSYGTSLAGELKGWGAELPTAYGGKGKDITEGLTVRYAAAAPAPSPAPATAPAPVTAAPAAAPAPVTAAPVVVVAAAAAAAAPAPAAATSPAATTPAPAPAAATSPAATTPATPVAAPEATSDKPAPSA